MRVILMCARHIVVDRGSRMIVRATAAGRGSLLPDSRARASTELRADVRHVIGVLVATIRSNLKRASPAADGTSTALAAVMRMPGARAARAARMRMIYPTGARRGSVVVCRGLGNRERMILFAC